LGCRCETGRENYSRSGGGEGMGRGLGVMGRGSKSRGENGVRGRKRKYGFEGAERNSVWGGRDV